MRLLVLAALAAVVVADVSELTGYQYNVPASSYGVPQSSVTERQFNALPTEPSPGLHLPAFEHQNFAINPYLGPTVSTTAAPFLDGGLVSSTTAPSVDSNLLVSSTPAPSLYSGFGFTTAAPSVSINSVGSESISQSGSVSSTPAPGLVITSGSQENLNLDAQVPNLGLSAFTTQAPALFSTPSTLAPGFGLGSYNFPGFGLNAYSTQAPITLGSGSLTSLGSHIFGSDAALNSINIQGFTSGGHAFGASPTYSAGTLSQAQQVSRHLYFFAAPEDPEPRQVRVNIAPVPPPRKSVKVIFIKAPTPPAPAPISIAAPPQDEEKTVVYVLVKKPEEVQNIEIQTPPPTPPAKPEIFFIKYKTPQEAEEAIAKVQGSEGVGAGVPASTFTGGGLIDSIQGQFPVTTSQPFFNYVSSTTTPGPLLNYIGGGISGPIGGGAVSGPIGGGFVVNPQLEADISQNLIGGQAIYSTPSPLISSTGDIGLIGSTTTVAPPLVPHSTYGPPLLKRK